jgi:hypothetical protein
MDLGSEKITYHYDSSVCSFKISPSGRLLAVGLSNGEVYVHSLIALLPREENLSIRYSLNEHLKNNGLNLNLL